MNSATNTRAKKQADLDGKRAKEKIKPFGCDLPFALRALGGGGPYASFGARSNLRFRGMPGATGALPPLLSLARIIHPHARRPAPSSPPGPLAFPLSLPRLVGGAAPIDAPIARVFSSAVWCHSQTHRSLGFV